MLRRDEFRPWSDVVMTWIEDYYNKLKDLPVKSQVSPSDVYDQISASIPREGENMQTIIDEVSEKILPGITHWQHPNFHAFFPANGSIESLLAEFITASIGAQCMIWDTSPAAAELEQRMMEWLGEAIGIPTDWEGVIQDTASSATLVALICAREKATDFTSNDMGVPNNLTVYASAQTHSSIEKAVGIAGMGRKNLRAIPVDDEQAMDLEKLESFIKDDIALDKKPTCVVVTLGTTGTLAVDDILGTTEICEKYGIWCHVDAAYAGSALMLPEYGSWMEGVEKADSFVFNPHKWLFTHFDCSAYFVKDADTLIRCFEILPEYLKTKSRGQVNDYRDWGVPLGRRFRALKLWFVLRSYGMEGIQKKLRYHIDLTEYAATQLNALPSLQHVVQPRLNGVFIAYTGTGGVEENNAVTQSIYDEINGTGKVYLSHTKLKGQLILRIIFGQTYLEKSDVQKTLEVIEQCWRKEVAKKKGGF